MNQWQENNFNNVLIGIQQLKFDIDVLELEKKELVKRIEKQNKEIEKLQNEIWHLKNP